MLSYKKGDNTMTKGQLAKQYFNSGLNCAQAVAMAFKDDVNLTEEQLKKVSIAFGGGFGRTRSVCGTVSGMTIVIGLLASNGDDKLAVYPIEQRAIELFKERFGTIICADLLDKRIPCADICEVAADIAFDLLKELGKI